MLKDRLFERENIDASSFQFNEEVAQVFDDMINRSVPLYPAIQELLLALTNRFYTSGTKIYDLGCSTGTTLEALLKDARYQSADIVAIDNSKEMLDRAKNRLSSHHNHIVFEQKNLEEGLDISNASVVIMNLVLQFLNPDCRSSLLKSIYNGLNEGGVFLLIEKINFDSDNIHDLYKSLYYDYKKERGYSQTEIDMKEKALEGVLRPNTIEKNYELLRNSGFSDVQTFFQCYNFVGFLAVK